MTCSESALLQATVSKQLPLVVEGKGLDIVVEDPETGEKTNMIDGCTGAAVGALGYQDEEMIEEITKAARESVYSFPLSLSNKNAEALGQYFIDKSPKGAFKAAIFTTSGSESNDNALKIIRQYHLEKNDEKRHLFISRDKSYHGYTIGSMSISGSRRHPFEPILLSEKQTPKVNNIYRYREQKEGESEEQYKDTLLNELENKFLEVGPDMVAAFITETVSGSTIGTEPPLPGYLEGCRDICHKYGALFVLDEVMCGLSRCGTLHAWEQFLPLDSVSSGAVGPDLQTIGKTLGSGLVTIAGVLISPKVRDAIVNGSNAIPGAQTYHSHSFSCRVALAVQKKIERDNLTKNIREVGNYMGELMRRELFKHTKTVGDVRGVGGFWSAEFVKSQATKEHFPAEIDFAHKIGAKCMKNGLAAMAVGGAGEVGDHVGLAPSYVITKAQAETMVERLVKSVIEAEKEMGL